MIRNLHLASLVCAVGWVAGCGGAAATPASTPAATQTGPEASSAQTASARADCDTPPPAVPVLEEGAATEAFSVTDPDQTVPAGTARVFSVNETILSSISEGGSDDIALHGVDACGLWLRELSIGSEIAGDPDRRDENITLIRATDGAFRIERLGAVLSAVAVADAEEPTVEVTTVEAIEAYQGE